MARSYKKTQGEEKAVAYGLLQTGKFELFPIEGNRCPKEWSKIAKPTTMYKFINQCCH